MIGIIVTGHGHFPSGLFSAVSLVAGKPERAETVDFTEGMSQAELREELEAAVNRLESEEILILADLVGGTPFNAAASLRTDRQDKSIKVVAGVNMPALVEAVFSRSMFGLDQLTENLLKAGRDGLVNLDGMETGETEPEFEDGL